MTDEQDPFSTELEAIAKKLPSIPSAYAELRRLLASLPEPPQPDLQVARSAPQDLAAAIQQAPGLGSGGVASSLSGLPPGYESGASIGRFIELFYGNSNLLDNATLEYALGDTIPAPGAVPGNSTEVDIAPSWRAFQRVNSGSAVTAAVDDLYDRLASNDNPFNSSIVGVYLGSAAGAIDQEVYIYPAVLWQPTLSLAPPFLIAQCRLTRYGNANDADLTTLTATMQILDAAGAVLAESTTMDLKALGGTFATPRLACSFARDAGAWWDEDYRWRLKIRIVSSGATATPSPVVFFGEPSLALATTQDAPPFAPIIGKWVPNLLRAFDRTDDPTLSARIELGLFNSPKQGGIRWGPGDASADIQLLRTAASALRFDPLTSNQDISVEIMAGAGERNALALFVAGDTNDRLILEGSATEQSIRFGPGNAGTDRAIQTYYTSSVASGATHFIPTANLPVQGCAMLVDDGNSCVGVMMWYRAGTFNGVWGTSLGGTATYEFRGTTLSAGAGTFSWYVEGNNTNDRLAVKNNAGFARGFRLLILSG